jgi:hypothetical protein
MPAEGDEQPLFLVEDLHAVRLAVRYPDVVIGINRNSLWPRKIPRPMARLAKGADELALGVEILNTIIQSIAVP